jgi:hypothetical protein
MEWNILDENAVDHAIGRRADNKLKVTEKL